MTRFTLHGIKRLDAEQVSTRVLYVLVALAVVLFGAFFLVGYDEPCADDPQFNAPLLTDAVLVFIYVLVAAAAVLAVVAAWLGFGKRDRSGAVVNNVPAARITWAVAALLTGCLVVTFAFGSSEPVLVNGVEYADVFWLNATDMFINTSIVLLAVAVLGVAFGVSGWNRKVKLRKLKNLEKL